MKLLNPDIFWKLGINIFLAYNHFILKYLVENRFCLELLWHFEFSDKVKKKVLKGIYDLKIGQ